MGIQRFIKAMKNQKDQQWLDIKGLTPLKFMSYVAELFRKVTSRDLKGLGDYRLDRSWQLLPLEVVGVGPAQFLPTPLRATGAHRTNTLTKWATTSM